jgi:hypothetical protein
MILCMPIPIIFFSSFLITWGSHNHSIKIKYMIGNPLGRTLFALARLHTLCHITITHPTCIIVMLEKLLGAKSFGGSINHLACRQAILLAYLGGFDLLFIIWTIALAFLGCQALITPTFVIHFQQYDHPILLGAVAHVEIGTSPFQMALQDV